MGPVSFDPGQQVAQVDELLLGVVVQVPHGRTGLAVDRGGGRLAGAALRQVRREWREVDVLVGEVLGEPGVEDGLELRLGERVQPRLQLQRVQPLRVAGDEYEDGPEPPG